MDNAYMKRRWAGKEKGQDRFDLALLSSSLMDRQSVDVIYFITCKDVFVKSGTSESLLTAFKRPISAPRAGLEPATYPASTDCSIQLSYRGDLIHDKESINVDYKSNIGSLSRL